MVRIWPGNPRSQWTQSYWACFSTIDTDQLCAQLKSSWCSISSHSSSHWVSSRRTSTWLVSQRFCSLLTRSQSWFSSFWHFTWSNMSASSIRSGVQRTKNMLRDTKLSKTVSIWKSTRILSSSLRSEIQKTSKLLSSKLRTPSCSRSTKTCSKCTDLTQWIRFWTESTFQEVNRQREDQTSRTALWSTNSIWNWMTSTKKLNTTKFLSQMPRSRTTFLWSGPRPSSTLSWVCLRFSINSWKATKKRPLKMTLKLWTDPTQRVIRSTRFTLKCSKC